MKNHVIVAPHADDEIIGCHSVLESGTVDIVMFPKSSVGIIDEAKKSSEEYGFEIRLFDSSSDLEGLTGHCMEKGGLIFFPDFVYELHPSHRFFGSMGYQLLSLGFINVIFYSTNMNAPYIREVDAQEKKGALNTCYPGKSDLWEYDHKYFLFEGQTRWLMNPESLWLQG